MNKSTKNVVEAQGAETQSTTEQIEINAANVEKWIKTDLGFALNLLNAIYTDPDMMASLAGFMLGRVQNAKLKKQQQKTE